MRSSGTNGPRINKECHEGPSFRSERFIIHQQGNIELHVELECQLRRAHFKVMARLHSTRDCRAVADVMAGAAPAELSLRHLSLVIVMSHFVTLTAVQQIKARSRLSMFPGRCNDRSQGQRRCAGMVHASSTSAWKQVLVDARHGLGGAATPSGDDGCYRGSRQVSSPLANPSTDLGAEDTAVHGTVQEVELWAWQVE
jgi:hypothetical protein